jgi:hypothetical protein
MNMERFQMHTDGFDILDLRAKFFFKTASSIGFHMAMGRFHGTILGGMQVHHPCSDHIKARIYIQLPKQCCDAKRLAEIGRQALRELAIPQDETYEFTFDPTEDGLLMVQPVDRDGMADRTW